MKIYCCGCNGHTSARLTNGREIYPHRKDLFDLPFWKCDTCRNFVGCHHKTSNPTNPLGCIPTHELRNARKEIHKILDPIWKSKRMSRRAIYAHLSKQLGKDFHTANIRTICEAREIYKMVKNLISD